MLHPPLNLKSSNVYDHTKPYDVLDFLQMAMKLRKHISSDSSDKSAAGPMPNVLRRPATRDGLSFSRIIVLSKILFGYCSPINLTNLALDWDLGSLLSTLQFIFLRIVKYFFSNEFPFTKINFFLENLNISV